MANLVITTTSNRINVEFNSYAENERWKTKYFNTSILIEVGLTDDETSVQVQIPSASTLQLSFDGNGNTLQVDTVNGIVPTSNSDLALKLSVLMG